MLSILSYVSGPSVLLGEVSVQVLCPFFNWIVCLPGAKSCEFFIYFGDQALLWGIIGKYIFPYGWFSLAEAFYFDEVPFVYSFLYVPCSRDISVKILLRGISEIFLPMFSSRTSVVSQLIFKFFIHLEFIFVYGVRWWLSLIFFFARSCPNLPTPSVEEAVFAPFYAAAPLSNINWP